jgi:site-specific recombinase XerD
MVMLGQNVDIVSIKQYLGHRSLNSTLAYTTVGDKEASEAARRAFMGAF